MCHTIAQKDGSVYLVSDVKGITYFIGVKQFYANKDGLQPHFRISQLYTVNKSGTFIAGLSLQNIDMQISFLHDLGDVHWTTVARSVSAGMHIYPFVVDVAEGEVCNKSLDETVEFCARMIRGKLTACTIPVMFTEEEIVFFDGSEVSVSAFRIAPPSALKGLFTEDYIKNVYTPVYKRISRVIKRQVELQHPKNEEE